MYTFAIVKKETRDIGSTNLFNDPPLSESQVFTPRNARFFV
jgi:hypothetical protein